LTLLIMVEFEVQIEVQIEVEIEINKIDIAIVEEWFLYDELVNPCCVLYLFIDQADIEIPSQD
jgi:hypothetical protein